MNRSQRSALLLALLFLPACGKVEHEENATPAPSATPAASASPIAQASPGPWTQIPTGREEDRVTVHYHRPGGNYAGAELWTWDIHKLKQPPENALMPLGMDAFGDIFQFDRAKYGNSDRIGLLPRIGGDWSNKDGSDRVWTPKLGHEVWIVSGKPQLFAQKPDLTPLLEAAYADRGNVLALRISEPVDVSALQAAHIHIIDDERHQVDVAQAIPMRLHGSTREIVNGPGSVSDADITVPEPLDFAHRHYWVGVDKLGEQPVIPRGLLDDPDLYYNPDAVLGVTYSPAETIFRVFAPTALRMSVVLYADAATATRRTVIPMHPISKGIWETPVAGNLAGWFYLYLPEGPDFSGQEVLDPYATNAVNSTTRARITPPTPPPYPPGPRPESPTDRIIYEMHVRDFTVSPSSGIVPGGLYASWTAQNSRLPGDPRIKTGLDSLVELGVTDVQIMPVQDFANDEYARQYNWGYITSAFFSPEGMYATNPADDSRIRELKALIAALHRRGIGVIMDVVYNHTSDTAPFFSMVPSYYYRQLPDGSLSDGSGCGNEFKTEAPMARKYLLDSLKYWATEYGVDGFRFDLMALLDRETMRQAEKELHAINPSIVLYGEPWTGGDTVLASKTDKTAFREVPVGAFNDDFRNALKGPPDGSDPGFIQDGSNRDALEKAMQVSDWFDAPGQSINYMTCHDNLTLWDKLKLSMPGASNAEIKAAAKLGYLILMTSPGVPFFQGGEEFGRSKGGNNNSYDAPDSVNEVDWTLKSSNYDLFTYVRDLIALRKEHPLFRMRTRAEVAARLRFLTPPSDKSLVYEIGGNSEPGETWRKAMVIANAGGEPIQIQVGDNWQVALNAKGAPLGDTAPGTVTVPPKSGMVLYQQN